MSAYEIWSGGQRWRYTSTLDEAVEVASRFEQWQRDEGYPPLTFEVRLSSGLVLETIPTPPPVAH